MTTRPNRSTAAPVALALVGLCLALIGPSGPASADHGPYDRRDLRSIKPEIDPLFEAGDVAAAITRYVKGIDNPDKLDQALAALGATVVERKQYDAAAEAFDRLVTDRRLDSQLIAGDLLINIVRQAPTSSYGLHKELRAFPDSLCERAASLLDHASPIVQAQGEWAVALRVKKQDSSTRFLKELFLRGYSDADWYRKWKARDAQHNLRDDYARQLVQLNRHRSPAGVAEAVGRVEARMAKLLADPATRADAKVAAAYQRQLQAAKQAAAGSDLARAHHAYLELREAARSLIVTGRAEFPSEGMVFYTNPRITGGVWNVNVAVTGRTNIPVGDLFVKRSADPGDDAEAVLGNKVGDGSIRGIDLDWNAERVLFSFWHQPIDGSQPFGWNCNKNACLYEMALAGGDVKQLTNEPGSNDIEPCFLPDGGYVFASDRSSIGNQCAGPILQNKRCTTLYRLDPKRADKPIAISNNKDFDRHPHVLNNGMIAFLHWEYQERDLYHLHNVWRCRPDGTSMDAYYKQHISTPLSIRDVQQAPDSQVHVGTAQGHHDAHNGALIIMKPAMGINNTEAMWLVSRNVSPVEGGLGPLYGRVVPEGGIENAGGSYINPFPMSDKAFLVGHDMTGSESEFALYYVDVWGNRELLHKDDDMSCFMPHPLRKREKPPIVSDQIDPQATHAVAFVQNVYRDLPGVEKGAVKHLRISQRLMLPAPVDYDSPNLSHNHLHYLPGDATTTHFGHWTWAPTRTVGLVDVNPDGSAYFKVPAGTPVFLQALDENYCEIRRMRTSFTLQRGEVRSCSGCHETRASAFDNPAAYPADILKRGPQTPTPPSWGDTTVLDYREHIQPIFDQHCVSCHNEDQPNGVDLDRREIGGFAQSYRSLFGLTPDDPTPIKEVDWHLVLHPEAKDANYIEGKAARDIHRRMQKNDWPGQLISISDRHSDAAITMPYQFGSNQSRLIHVMLDDPVHRDQVKPRMTDEQWLMLVTWVDHNAVYHGTVFDVRNYKETGKFRRVPYYLPDPWRPADLNPSFYNVADTSEKPKGR